MEIKVGKTRFDVSICKSLFSHFLGLMFRFPKNDGLLFIFREEQEIALHMLFVFFPVDIVYLNKNREVTRILNNVKPFTPYLSPIKCRYILELKDSKNIKIGDKLSM